MLGALFTYSEFQHYSKFESWSSFHLLMKPIFYETLQFFSFQCRVKFQFECSFVGVKKKILTLFVFNYPTVNFFWVNFHRFDFVKHVLIARWFSVFACRLNRAKLLSTAKPAKYFLGLAWRIQTTASLFAVVRRKNQFEIFVSSNLTNPKRTCK